ncbi:unnamed protein product (macronuclear) [Paramecium tetraurelia]|uniref:Trichohyalin-plectin-homology domain-containing protein n=1 Tax=Paramecium tetraurelia TaxID=5888 RepID=A0BLK0_PARTE|nr:uncharacterized protein GSPATT00030050001 [Paramecium tetraurelia]CAK59417.1 unnamed protein product [Paramecium tetraurelia]|eukprot:XP_001426815.1 hypothetical protein (macronuclear) [Paramecium tetraurelia strain d4-2]
MNLETLLDQTHRNTRRGIVFQHTRKAFTIKPDSPKTREACLALGYDPNIFQFKQLEDFAEAGISENVQKMRFDHYMKKTEGALQEISKVRKIIIKKQKNITNLHLEKSYQRDEELVNDLIETYNKKMSSIDKEDKDASYLSFDEDDPILVLEQQLEKEIAKYKKSLQIKAKEVQHQLNNEKRRQKLHQDMIEREKKIEELKFKISIQKARKKKEMKQASQKKVNEIKQKEREKQIKLLEDRKRQAEKEEKIRKKLEQDEISHKKELDEQERKYQERRLQIQLRKTLQDRQYNQQMAQTMTQIQQKWAETSLNKEKQIWESKLERLTLRSSCMKKNQSNTNQELCKRKNPWFSLLFKNQQAKKKILKVLLLYSLALKQSKEREEQNKLKDEKLRRRKIEKSLKNIKSQQFDRVDSLQKKFQLLEDYSLKRKEELDYQKSLKQERMKLKQQDLIENYQRQERLKDLRFKSLIKSSQQLNEQKSLEKVSNELIRKAQQELQRKLKKDSENLDQSLVNVSQADEKVLNLRVSQLEKSLSNLKQSSKIIH